MQMIRKLCILLVMGALGSLDASALEIQNPRCEYRVNPLGLDVTHPRLSWELASDQRGVRQPAVAGLNLEFEMRNLEFQHEAFTRSDMGHGFASNTDDTDDHR